MLTDYLIRFNKIKVGVEWKDVASTKYSMVLTNYKTCLWTKWEESKCCLGIFFICQLRKIPFKQSIKK